RRIYQAIRARDTEGARSAMNEHLICASTHQALEPGEVKRVKRRVLGGRGERRSRDGGSNFRGSGGGGKPRRAGVTNTRTIQGFNIPNRVVTFRFGQAG